ncbi:MAG: ammonia-forming cytochrome c nitrite reductase subunit c552 [Deltaproteobacteria bacterium]|nr:ammonia-forming cytochrome c nitrite reductase subunit c552 [Deltaproteobacteria bacterium]
MGDSNVVHVKVRRRVGVFVATSVVVAGLTAATTMLLVNVFERKEEAKHHVFKVVDVTEETIDPAVWGKNFPRQYDSYKRTVDIERTKHGGSEAFQKLEDDPRWRELFRGYAFGVDYREERGHAYMLSDQEATERVTKFKQPGACLHCHSAVVPAYREAGKKAGVTEAGEAQLMKGFEIVNAMPYADARKMVAHPISCGDCHAPDSMQLRVTRPGFVKGIRALATGSFPVPQYPSIERWRRGNRVRAYDVNAEASRQEMRTFVCGQCHVEYYFKGDAKLLTYPWHKGLLAEQIEAYYDEAGFKDWTHATTGAPLLKAQHPEFEMWSQGIHARSGVSCADCHMPYKREGAIKVSDHHVRSPVLNIARACQTCHRFAEKEIKARVEAIQDRTKALMLRAEEAVVALIAGIGAAKAAGASDEAIMVAQTFHRKAEWRLDFVAAENSMGFHAPQEAARLLAEAIDFGRQGQVEALKAAQTGGVRGLGDRAPTVPASEKKMPPR